MHILYTVAIQQLDHDLNMWPSLHKKSKLNSYLNKSLQKVDIKTFPCRFANMHFDLILVKDRQKLSIVVFQNLPTDSQGWHTNIIYTDVLIFKGYIAVLYITFEIMSLICLLQNAPCIHSKKPVALSGRKSPTNSSAMFLQGSQIPGITVNLGWLSKKPGLHLLPCILITRPEPEQKLLCHSGKWNNKFSVGEKARPDRSRQQIWGKEKKNSIFIALLKELFLFSFCFLSILQ